MSYRKVFLGALFWAALGATVGHAAGDVQRAPEFACAEVAASTGSLVVLSMPVPHGGDLAVRTPDKKTIFILTVDQAASEFLPSGEKFKEMEKLILHPENVKGLVDGVEKTIFSKAGTYEFLLGENLETDGPPDYRCKVRLKKKK